MAMVTLMRCLGMTLKGESAREISSGLSQCLSFLFSSLGGKVFVDDLDGRASSFDVASPCFSLYLLFILFLSYILFVP